MKINAGFYKDVTYFSSAKSELDSSQKHTQNLSTLSTAQIVNGLKSDHKISKRRKKNNPHSFPALKPVVSKESNSSAPVRVQENHLQTGRNNFPSFHQQAGGNILLLIKSIGDKDCLSCKAAVTGKQ